MKEKNVNSSTKKTCPLLSADARRAVGWTKCLGDKCALFIKITKPRMFDTGAGSYPDPETYLAYRGCGLIRAIPWSVEKRELKKESTTKTEGG